MNVNNTKDEKWIHYNDSKIIKSWVTAQPDFYDAASAKAML